MKKIASCLTAVALSMMSLSTLGSGNASANNIEPTEVISMRSEYGKHFDNGDGTMTEYLNTVPLHYFENGEWVEYDNSLELDDNGNYTNLNSPLSITVPSEINTNSTAELVSNGHTLSISLNNIFDCSENDYIQGSIPKKETLNKKLPTAMNAAFQKSVSSVVFTSAEEKKELELDVRPYSLIETLSFDNNDDPESFTYVIQADDLTAEKDEDGNVNFIETDGSVAFTIVSPVIVDSSEHYHHVSVSMDVNSCNNGYCLTLTPNEMMDELVSPLTMSMEYSVQRNAFTCYNSQFSPDIISYSALRIGNIANNGYQSFVNCGETFAGYNGNVTITDASFNMYLVDQYLPQQKKLKIYSINALPQSCNWTNNSTLGANNTFITDFYVTTSDRCSWKEVSVTPLVQSWLNSAKTSQEAGVPYYGFKIVTDSTPAATVIANSESANSNHPYFEIEYVIDSDYTLTYAPYKYNDIVSDSNSGLGSIYNFQNRMNCYAYALQIYNSGNNIYQLFPGYIGLRQNGMDYTLSQLRSDYGDCSSITAFMNFTEQQMEKDFIEMGTNLSRITLVNDEQFVLPSTYNENTGRIIAMNAAKRTHSPDWPIGSIYPPYDFHFYLRHGNGTCPNHHNGVCSVWSHKMGNQAVSNTVNNEVLCDNNIATLATTLSTSGSGIVTEYSETLRFYIIEQDMNAYDSWYNYINDQAPVLYHN